ncbi:Nuclear pore complex protein Nup88 [Lucilia cuprina]|nr:Nuclear pore complex protein Nup88 [Lucilia cuprina]
MASTDCLQLNKTSMFAKIRASLPMERLQTQNLLECKDDLLYCWDSQENSLLVLNWRAAVAKGFEEIKYQILAPNYWPEENL